MLITLGEDQINAINSLQKFLGSTDVAISLCGFAGTGKTLITKILIDYLEANTIPYVLCAPTHVAKLVLEQATERQGVTLHKLLALTPNIEILELDFRELQFYVGNKSTLFPSRGVVICDEASMINDDLFDLLVDKAIMFQSKLIFSGDVKQLKPVNALTHSKVFSLPNTINLTKIYRQSTESALVEVLPILRNNIIPRFTTQIGTEGSVVCFDDIQEFVKAAVPIFRKAIKTSNILETKILAYTNKRVDAFNQKFKEILFSKEVEYSKFEFLTCYENLEFNYMPFSNSMDYIIIGDPIQTDIQIPNFMSMPGWKLLLYDSANEISAEILMLSKICSPDYFLALAELIENTRLEAIQLKNVDRKGSNKLWNKYYSIINSFTSPIDLFVGNRVIRKKSFDYGYATTVHKSQGKTLNNVFIDMKNILLCRDEEELRQLQYVAISRTKNNVYIFQ